MTNPKILKAQVKRWMSEQKDEVEQTDKSIDELKGELSRIKKEEQRYIKAYGAEVIDSEQLKESTEDLKKQKKSIEQQIFSMQKDTVVEHFDYPEDKEIDEFCKIAHKVIGDMGFEAKQAIVRKVVDTIVGTQHNIKVYGHLALNSSIIANVWKGGVQDVKFKTSSRNSENETPNLDSNSQLEPEPTFSEDKVIPFQFTVKMPSPRYHLMILDMMRRG